MRPGSEKTPVLLDDAITASLREIEKAEKTVILVSPDSSLEQMIAIKSLADNLGATISGFSDGYIKKDDGDDFLIQDDKAANRAGLDILGIDTSKATFEETLAESQLLINFNNNLSLSYDEPGLKNLFKDKRVIVVTSQMSTTDRDPRVSTVLALPAATRSLTSADVSP